MFAAKYYGQHGEKRQHRVKPIQNMQASNAGTVKMPPSDQLTNTLILASSSKYRLKLLNQIGLHPLCIAPDIDETPNPLEHAEALASRLSAGKARAVAKDHHNAIIIAGDQVCDFDGAILGKPGDAETAKQQLTLCSGREVIFHTGLCVLNTRNNKLQIYTERVLVEFRALSSQEIDTYIVKEPAFDCAGSFKMEGLGISLFKRIRSEDPNSLIGLPLIKLCEFLRNEGLSVI
ncbi:MAG: septum formation protein [Zhongshania sp.]